MSSSSSSDAPYTISQKKSSEPMQNKMTHSNPEESKRREAKLAMMFKEADLKGDGILDSEELTVVARLFDPEGTDREIKEQVQTILTRFDHESVGHLKDVEWIRALNEIFQFMSPDAFNHHCDELLEVLREYKTKQVGQGGFFHLSNDAKNNNIGKSNSTNKPDNFTLYSAH